MRYSWLLRVLTRSLKLFFLDSFVTGGAKPIARTVNINDTMASNQLLYRFAILLPQFLELVRLKGFHTDSLCSITEFTFIFADALPFLNLQARGSSERLRHQQ